MAGSTQGYRSYLQVTFFDRECTEPPSQPDTFEPVEFKTNLKTAWADVAPIFDQLDDCTEALKFSPAVERSSFRERCAKAADLAGVMNERIADVRVWLAKVRTSLTDAGVNVTDPDHAEKITQYIDNIFKELDVISQRYVVGSPAAHDK